MFLSQNMNPSDDASDADLDVRLMVHFIFILVFSDMACLFQVFGSEPIRMIDDVVLQVGCLPCF